MSTLMISADSHVTEPPNTYVDNIDPAYRDRAPKMIDHEKLGDVFVIDGMSKPISLATAAAAGKRPDEIKSYGAKFDQLHPGGWDPNARHRGSGPRRRRRRDHLPDSRDDPVQPH